ncbi:MAG: hypothetical protein PHP50_09620 [Lachnospiraceae bacterium]|nr:hypothetical protein [Lachnospiraceae bacterium]
MKIKEVIDRVDSVKPNSYETEDKVRWLSYLEGTIFNDVIKTHEPELEMEEEFQGYTPDDLERDLYVRFPYDELYVAYLKMKIDEENGETARYNNSAVMYNTIFTNFAKQYNKTHKPVGRQLKIF